MSDKILLFLLCVTTFSCSIPIKKDKVDEKVDSSKIQFLDNNWNETITIDSSLRIKTREVLGVAEERYIIGTKTNDTFFRYSNYHGAKFFLDRKIETIFDKREYFHSKIKDDTLKIKYIRFNNKGQFIAYRGPLDFLTRQDTLDLNNSYPDWKEQVAEFQKKGNVLQRLF